MYILFVQPGKQCPKWAAGTWQLGDHTLKVQGLIPPCLCIFILLCSCIFIMLCLCIFIVPASTLTTLTEVFPWFFLSCKENARVRPAKMGHGPHFQIFVLFYVLFVLCHSVYCLCVNVYCTTATSWLPNCSQQIYHIISNHTNSVALVRTRTIPTERLPPVGEVSANFCG